MPISSAMRADVLGFNENVTPVTIDTNGLLTVSRTYVVMAAFSGVTDNLDNIALDTSTTFNPILILVADAGDTITVRHNQGGIGNIFLHAGITQIDVTPDEPIFFYYSQSADRAYQLSASNDTLAGITADNYATVRGNGTVWEAVQNNFGSATNPTANDDSNDGYAVGSVWVNTTDDIVYVAADVTVGAAIWSKIESSSVTTISTTDATVTTMATITVAEEEAIIVSYDLIAHRDDFTSAAYGSIKGGFYRASGGNVTKISTSSDGGDKVFESDSVAASIDTYFEVTTTTVLIRIVGVAAQNWNWKISYTVTRLS